MRIARVLTRLNLGGPARQALASDPLLVARGHELRLFAGRSEPGEGDLFDVLRARGVDVVRVEGLQRGPSVRDLFVARRLRHELAAFRPDVLHTHASKAGALGRAAARGRGFVRLARVHTFHGHVLEGYFPALLSARLVAAERRLAQDTDRIVAVSHATADDLLRLGVVGEDKLVVIQPGIELAALLSLSREERTSGARALRAFVGAKESDFLVGLVGRLAEVKEPLRALGVFQTIAGHHAGLQLVYVGDGAERRALERGIGALPEALRARVHLLGAREDMPDVLSALDALLLTSRSEGLPVALIEAAAAALPVVARAVGGVPELVVHERTGLVGTSDEELAFALDKLLTNRGEARAMGERARLRVTKTHGAETLATRLEQLYQLVCAERAGREVQA
ncbi:MAG: glycosyltransferase family 1 protein [Planctomycetes bacterium]|nr:glycosyltransferase family 1 protein [Planctomycetota bacterium]